MGIKVLYKIKYVRNLLAYTPSLKEGSNYDK